MARPIKETPILTGNDAITFLEEINKNFSKKVSETERNRMKSAYSKFKSIATFQLP
jgi:uncharacterized protein YktA (UPF0223 family)